MYLLKKEFNVKEYQQLLTLKILIFKVHEKAFQLLIKGKFRIQNIISIKVKQTKKIIAPSYFFYPNTDEKEQIKQAKRHYLNYDYNED